MVSEQVTKLILGTLGVTTGFLSFLVLFRLKESSRTSMARMKLSPGKTINDFRIIAVNNAVMFVGFLIYVYSKFASNETLWILSKMVGILYGAVFIFVMFRWWRRLR